MIISCVINLILVTKKLLAFVEEGLSNGNLHGRNGGSGTRGGGKSGEGGCSTSLLDIVVRERRREVRSTIEGLSSRDDIRTINEVGLVLTNEGKLSHSCTKLGRHRLLVKSELLPDASSGGVMGEVMVRFETEGASDGGLDFAVEVLGTVGDHQTCGQDEGGNGCLRDEELASEDTLNVELGVESGRGGVKGRARALRKKNEGRIQMRSRAVHVQSGQHHQHQQYCEKREGR
jgi:hypothetical protein